MYLSVYIRRLYLLIACLCLLNGSVTRSMQAQFAFVQWEQAGGPYGGDFSSIIRDPVTKRVWAGVSGSVYYSDDRGDSWTLALQQDADQVAVAVIDETIFAGHYFSVDAGISWQQHTLPDTLTIYAIATEVAESTVIVSTNYGIYSSQDFGQNWQVVLDGTGEWRLWSFPGHSLFAQNLDLAHIFYRSENGGLTWDPFHLGTLLDVTVGPDSSAYLLFERDDYAEFHTSSAFGGTWRDRDGLFSCGATGIIGFSSEDEMLLIKDGVVKNSRGTQDCEVVYNGAKTYRFKDVSRPIKSFLFDNEEGFLLVDTGFGELLRSEDNGATWNVLDVSGVINTTVTKIEIDNRNGSIWAGTLGRGLYSSSDRGQNWNYRGFITEAVGSIAIGDIPGEYWASTYEEGLHYSLDYGETWKPLEDGNQRFLAFKLINDAASGVFYAQTEHNVYHFGTAGEAWQGISTPTNAFFNPALVALTQGIGGNLIAFIRYDQYRWRNGVFSLPDVGAEWEKVDDDFFEAFYGDNVLNVDALGRLWASNERTVYRSLDEGKSWEELITTPGLVNDLMHTPDGSVWIAHEEGLLRSTDNGQSWQEEMEGLHHQSVLSLAWNPVYRELLAGTQGGGMYRGVTEISVANEHVVESQDEVALSNYPNPVSTQATIQFDLHQAMPVQLTLFDQLGRPVQHVVDRQLSAGRHRVKIALHDLAPGVYFYQLQTPKGLYTRSLVHIR